jgi:KaiC/GvpD/RAD55 family RecA-like ATPase
MVSTGVPSFDQLLGNEGYPDRSAILLEGPPGIGKEALAYWFIRSGLIQGDYCLYATHRAVSDVLRDMRGVGIGTERVPDWIASLGSGVKCELRDHASILFNIKKALHDNAQRRSRVATDVLSPLLVLNTLDSMLMYWSQLVKEMKQQDSVLLALGEVGVNPPNVLTTIEQLFDGVIEMRLYEEGLSIIPLIRVKKMLGLPPLHGYFKFSISSTGMEVAAHAV